MPTVEINFINLTELNSNRWSVDWANQYAIFEPKDNSFFNFKVRSANLVSGYGGIKGVGNTLKIGGQNVDVNIAEEVDSSGWQNGSMKIDSISVPLANEGQNSIDIIFSFSHVDETNISVNGKLEVFWRAIDKLPPVIVITTPTEDEVISDDTGNGQVTITVTGRVYDEIANGVVSSGLDTFKLNGTTVVPNIDGFFTKLLNVSVVSSTSKGYITAEAKDKAGNVTIKEVSFFIKNSYIGWVGGGLASSYDPNWKQEAKKVTAITAYNTKAENCDPVIIIEIKKDPQIIGVVDYSDFIALVRREGANAPQSIDDGVLIYPPTTNNTAIDYGISDSKFSITDSDIVEGKTYSYSVFSFKVYPKFIGTEDSDKNPYAGYPELNPDIIGGSVNSDTLSEALSTSLTAGRMALMYGSEYSIAYYAFENNLLDGAQYRADLTLDGNIEVSYIDGPVGKTAYLNTGTFLRTDGKPYGTINTIPETTAQMSISFIVKASSPVNAILFSRQDEDTFEAKRSFIVQLQNTGKLVFTVYGSDGIPMSRVSTSSVCDNAYHYIVCAFSSSTAMDIYIDGLVNMDTALYYGTNPNAIETNDIALIKKDLWSSSILRSAFYYACYVNSSNYISATNLGYTTNSNNNLHFRALRYNGNGNGTLNTNYKSQKMNCMKISSLSSQEYIQLLNYWTNAQGVRTVYDSGGNYGTQEHYNLESNQLDNYRQEGYSLINVGEYTNTYYGSNITIGRTYDKIKNIAYTPTNNVLASGDSINIDTNIDNAIIFTVKITHDGFKQWFDQTSNTERFNIKLSSVPGIKKYPPYISRIIYPNIPFTYEHLLDEEKIQITVGNSRFYFSCNSGNYFNKIDTNTKGISIIKNIFGIGIQKPTLPKIYSSIGSYIYPDNSNSYSIYNYPIYTIESTPYIFTATFVVFLGKSNFGYDYLFSPSFENGEFITPAANPSVAIYEYNFSGVNGSLNTKPSDGRVDLPDVDYVKPLGTIGYTSGILHGSEDEFSSYLINNYSVVPFDKNGLPIQFNSSDLTQYDSSNIERRNTQIIEEVVPEIKRYNQDESIYPIGIFNTVNQFVSEAGKTGQDKDLVFDIDFYSPALTTTGLSNIIQLAGFGEDDFSVRRWKDFRYTSVANKISEILESSSDYNIVLYLDDRIASSTCTLVSGTPTDIKSLSIFSGGVWISDPIKALPYTLIIGSNVFTDIVSGSSSVSLTSTNKLGQVFTYTLLPNENAYSPIIKFELNGLSGITSSYGNKIVMVCEVRTGSNIGEGTLVAKTKSYIENTQTTVQFSFQDSSNYSYIYEIGSKTIADMKAIDAVSESSDKYLSHTGYMSYTNLFTNPIYILRKINGINEFQPMSILRIYRSDFSVELKYNTSKKYDLVINGTVVASKVISTIENDIVLGLYLQKINSTSFSVRIAYIDFTGIVFGTSDYTVNTSISGNMYVSYGLDSSNTIYKDIVITTTDLTSDEAKSLYNYWTTSNSERLISDERLVQEGLEKILESPVVKIPVDMRSSEGGAFVIGSDLTANYPSFTGYIDEVGLYKTYFTSTQAKTIYDILKNGGCLPSNWALEEPDVVNEKIETYVVPSTDSFVDNNIVSGKTYTYAMYAYDAAGNISPLSSTKPIRVGSKGTFDEPVRITKTKSNAVTPAIAIDCRGNISIAWADDRNS
mgnify:CR=1 FL=1